MTAPAIIRREAAAARTRAGAASADLAARTVEGIASTFAETSGPGGHALDPAGADLSRLVGGPFLDNHRAASTRDILGVIEKAEIAREGLIFRARLRDNEAADAVLRSIADGTIRGVSVGYTVQAWREERRGRGVRRIAARWTPLEISAVAIPADAAARFRQLRRTT